MARKKIIFVIVEGPSDDEALGVIFNRLYDKQSVHIEITHGDITSDKNFSPHNIVSKVGDIVKLYAKFNHYTKNDFLKIIHIMDVDGAYIPDEYVIENALITDKPIYSLINIQAQNPSNICKRNHHKCTNMDRLLDDFLFFICDSDFSLCGDYSESWEFIRKGLNSLNRYSNLGICFVDIRKSKDITAT